MGWRGCRFQGEGRGGSGVGWSSLASSCSVRPDFRALVAWVVARIAEGRAAVPASVGTTRLAALAGVLGGGECPGDAGNDDADVHSGCLEGVEESCEAAPGVGSGVAIDGAGVPVFCRDSLLCAPGVGAGVAVGGAGVAFLAEGVLDGGPGVGAGVAVDGAGVAPFAGPELEALPEDRAGLPVLGGGGVGQPGAVLWGCGGGGFWGCGGEGLSGHVLGPADVSVGGAFCAVAVFGGDPDGVVAGPLVGGGCVGHEDLVVAEADPDVAGGSGGV